MRDPLQPKNLSLFQASKVYIIGVLFMGFGLLFVLSSMYRLGITGTYLGDYFNILMSGISII